MRWNRKLKSPSSLCFQKHQPQQGDDLNRRQNVLGRSRRIPERGVGRSGAGVGAFQQAGWEAGPPFE